MPDAYRRAAFWTVIVLAFVPPAAASTPADLQIQVGKDAVTVTTGNYAWTLSTTAFDVIHSASVGGKQRLGPGRVTVDALGGHVVFGPPSEVTNGGDRVELRGWADRAKNLWYIAHYQFFAGRPFFRLILTLTDRHDSSPSAEPWEPHWNNRLLAKWRLEVGAPGGKPTTVTQNNSYSFTAPGAPWIEVVGASGAPYQWTPPSDAALMGPMFQLIHGTKDGANQIVYHPAYSGKAAVTVLLTPFSGGTSYRAAKGVTYEVVDAAGHAQAKVVAQTADKIELGTFQLGPRSTVRVKATGGGGEELAIAGALRITPVGGGRPFDIRLAERHDGVLADGPVAIALKDFWQHHPISLFRTETAIGWQAIEKPEQYTGGMGLTLETMISMDGPAAPATAALYAPPRRALPPQVRPIDGTLAHGPMGARYDALLKVFASGYQRDLERMDNFGWRNWGDYQIGVSYSADAGPVEDWANLQYDLPNGLLLAWLRTGDPALWRLAQASVRHLMDLDLVKFHPFMDKLDGLVYRKGEMPRSRSHIGAEPITDQGFAFRSLLLYHHLTGEPWALELAKQNIDRLVYYAVTRPHFVVAGDRPTGWMLRAALAGAEAFPQDKTYDYRAVAEKIVGQLVEYYDANKRLPGGQPVWEGQMVEGLAEYHRRTGRADVARVIVGHMRHLLTNCLRRRPDGRYELLYCYRTSQKDCGTTEWVDEDNYVFLWLSGIEYAYKLTGDPFFAKWADTLFSYGEAHMREHPDTRPWTSALAHPFLFLDLAAARPARP